MVIGEMRPEEQAMSLGYQQLRHWQVFGDCAEERPVGLQQNNNVARQMFTEKPLPRCSNKQERKNVLSSPRPLEAEVDILALMKG